MSGYRWILYVAAALFASDRALASEWRMDPSRSRLEFVANAQGSDFTGRFGRFTPRIRFDPGNPAGASFDVAIELASVDTRNAERDEALPSRDFFWTEKFPRARFTAAGCKPLPAKGRFQCEGTLSLRGKSRKLAFPFAWNGDARTARLSASVPLNRLDFGIGTGEWGDPATIGHRVTVKIALVLRAVAPVANAPASRP